MKRIALFALTAFALLLGLGTLGAPKSSAQQTPAQSLIGQQVTSCKGDSQLRFSIVSADWTKTIIDRTAGGMWVSAVADVTNSGPDVAFIQGRVKLRDDRGREFDWKLFNGENLYVETDLATQYGVTPSWQGFERLVTTRTVLIFDVASDARTLTLLPDALSCTAGATPPAVVAPTPATTLIGQSTVACKGELSFRFTVVRAEWRRTIIDRPAQDGSMWVVAIADVTNLGSFTDSGQGLAKVKDNQNREFDWRLFNGENIYVEDQIAAEFGLRASWELSDPGIANRTVLLFEVAANARTLQLLPNNIGCGG